MNDKKSYVNELDAFGSVIWVTGLSGAGKTTLSQEIVKFLRSEGHNAIFLDGDELRDAFGFKTEHDRDSRLKIATAYSKLCKLLSSQGFIVVIATISMFNEIYAWNRKTFHYYFEIYIKVSMDELVKRDPKGIYKKYFAGELKNVSGLDFSIDEPSNPDWVEKFGATEQSKILTDELKNSIKEFLKNEN